MGLGFRTNHNGDTFATLEQQNRALRMTLAQVRGSLGMIKPHGRNYQSGLNAKDHFKADREYHGEAMQAMKFLDDYLEDHTNQLSDQKRL